MATMRPIAPPLSRDTGFMFTLEEILDGPRPGRFEPARDAAWLILRREVHEVAHDAGFDVRQVLGLPPADARLWYARRLTFLARHFASDPRVEATR